MVGEPDGELYAVADWFRAHGAAARFSEAIRQSFDEVYDGQRTGRYALEQLSKVEKTYLGTKVEIIVQAAFGLARGAPMDYLVHGVNVDCKWSMKAGGWMIPREAVGHICLCITADDAKSEFSVGLVRATPDRLRESRNQDQKTQLNPRGLASMLWLVRRGPLAENLLLHLPAGDRARVLDPELSGQARVDQLFRIAQGRLVSRQAVVTVAQQHDGPKRVRDARHRLQPEGIVVLGHQQSHPQIAAALGLPVPYKGSWVSGRVLPVPTPGAGVAPIRGRLWRLAEPDEPPRPGPVDYQ